MAGIDLDEIGELAESRQRFFEERTRPVFAVLCEVRPGEVADKQKIRRQQVPGIFAAIVIEDQEVDLLGSMPGSVKDLQAHITEGEPVTGCHASGVVGDLGELRQYELAAASRRAPDTWSAWLCESMM